jgi:hypothetical protein
LVFDSTQCFQHLAGQEEFCPPLRLYNRQHSASSGNTRWNAAG